MPLISTLANASARGYRIFAAAETNSFESIATVTVGGGGSSSISFSSIPSTFKHLQIRLFAKAAPTAASGAYDLRLSFNSDTTGTNYNEHYLYGNGSGVGAGVNTNNRIIGTATGSASTSTFAANVYDILDYQNTNKYKTIRCLSGWDANGSGEIKLLSQVWMSTSAINAISIDFNSGSPNFGQYSQAALYGIKG